MPAVTQQFADSVYIWSNVLLVVGASLALIGTLGTFWSSGVRDKFSNERIAANEAETAKAKGETAKAQLEQQRLKALMAWRRVSVAQAEKLAEALRGSGLELWLTFVGDDPESTVYRQDIEAALSAAGIKTHYFSGYAVAVGLSLKGGTTDERALLLSAFRQAGLPLESSEQVPFGNAKIEITVGTKPPPEF